MFAAMLAVRHVLQIFRSRPMRRRWRLADGHRQSMQRLAYLRAAGECVPLLRTGLDCPAPRSRRIGTRCTPVVDSPPSRAGRSTQGRAAARSTCTMHRLRRYGLRFRLPAGRRSRIACRSVRRRSAVAACRSMRTRLTVAESSRVGIHAAISQCNSTWPRPAPRWLQIGAPSPGRHICAPWPFRRRMQIGARSRHHQPVQIRARLLRHRGMQIGARSVQDRRLQIGAPSLHHRRVQIGARSLHHRRVQIGAPSLHHRRVQIGARSAAACESRVRERDWRSAHHGSLERAIAQVSTRPCMSVHRVRPTAHPRFWVEAISNSSPLLRLAAGSAFAGRRPVPHSGPPIDFVRLDVRASCYDIYHGSYQLDGET
jgi:hypothetical protein